MSEKIVSIVVPCYNGESYLDRFFLSILSQTYPALELVFVNDGSTDQTEKIVTSYIRPLKEKGVSFVYIGQENAGQAAALNAGLKKFTGSYLTCMDSDDELYPDAIEKKVEYLEAHPEKAFCYGKAVAVNEENPDKIIGVYAKRESSHSFFEDILYVNDVFFPGYLMRKEAFERAVPNRDIYSGKGGQNAQILLPMSWYYGEPAYVDNSVYKYYIRNNSHSHNINNGVKIIQQLYNYEKILIHTIKRISDPEAEKYIPKIQKYYARLRFGNALDTTDPELIAEQYKELSQQNAVNLHDIGMYFKYAWLGKYKKNDVK